MMLRIERDYTTVSRLSVRLSVTLRCVFQTGWNRNTSKMTSRPNSLMYLVKDVDHGRRQRTNDDAMTS